MEVLCIPLASAIAETVTHPVDALKTREQVAQKRSLVSVARLTVEEVGVRGLYPALPAALLRHWVYSTLRVALYERLRSENDGLALKAAAAGAAGAVAQGIASPLDLLKVRLQTGGPAVGMASVCASVYRAGGLAGFYYGWRPNVARAAAVNIGELASYDVGKSYGRQLFTGEMPVVFFSALFSGACATLLSCPADVLKSRMMSGKYDGRSMLDCARETARIEGPLAFWRGAGANWARLGPWQMIFWISYEKLRIFTTGESFK
jgi:solute carrier family 25 uncoupling protein 27